MEDDILAKVVEVEKDIQKSLETEKIKAAEWLENLKRDTEREAADSEAQLREQLEKAVADARTGAEKRAAELLKNAEVLARKLEGLSDESLRSVIMKHITSILPGG